MKIIQIPALAGLLLSMLLLSSCQSLFKEEPVDNPRVVFDQLWTTFEESYAPFAERGVDWDESYSRFSPQITEQSTDDQLFAVLTAMLSELDDGHVQLVAPGRDYFYANRYFRERIDDELFDLDLIREGYLQGTITEGPEESYTYGQLEGGIVYLHLPFISDNLPILPRIIAENLDAPGLIIDLRHNSGGDFTWAFAEMGALVDEKRLVFHSRTKNGPGKEDFTPWFEWHVEPSGTFFPGKVVVLTDRYTISAGERTAMAFKVLPHVTIVGDTTNGAHSTMIGRELANGWAHTLATQQVLFADGQSYEGIGVIPDVYIQNAEADIAQGRDAVLEKAMSLAK